jgi:hypothetical protein
MPKVECQGCDGQGSATRHECDGKGHCYMETGGVQKSFDCGFCECRGYNTCGECKGKGKAKARGW